MISQIKELFINNEDKRYCLSIFIDSDWIYFTYGVSTFAIRNETWFFIGYVFVVLILKRDFKLGFIVALVTDIFTALTTGQIANIVDKMVEFLIVFLIIGPIMNNVNNKVGTGLITLIGTLISSAVFLSTAGLLFGLPGPFFVLFYTIEIPVSLINALTGVVIFSSIKIGG